MDRDVSLAHGHWCYSGTAHSLTQIHQQSTDAEPEAICRERRHLRCQIGGHRHVSVYHRFLSRRSLRLDNYCRIPYQELLETPFPRGHLHHLVHVMYSLFYS